MGVTSVPLARQRPTNEDTKHHMGYQLLPPPQKKLPLRKCMQCHQMKREQFSVRCRLCYETNEHAWLAQRAANGGGPTPNANLIGWDYSDTLPGLNDYLLYFLRWLYARLFQKNSPQDSFDGALCAYSAHLALMKRIERDIDMSPATAEAMNILARGVSSTMFSLRDTLPGQQPHEEPLPIERGVIELVACEVRYE
jgi:hypothetical protein